MSTDSRKRGRGMVGRRCNFGIRGHSGMIYMIEFRRGRIIMMTRRVIPARSIIIIRGVTGVRTALSLFSLIVSVELILVPAIV